MTISYPCIRRSRMLLSIGDWKWAGAIEIYRSTYSHIYIYKHMYIVIPCHPQNDAVLSKIQI